MIGWAPLLTVALLAVLVGAALPVLYQMYRALKSARAVLDGAGPRLEQTLEKVGRAADRLNGIGSTLDAEAQTLRPLFEAACTLGQSIGRSGKWLGTALTVGGALGPAVMAGVRAFFSRRVKPTASGGHPAHRDTEEGGPNGRPSLWTHTGGTP